jgi:hypothetical protein
MRPPATLLIIAWFFGSEASPSSFPSIPGLGFWVLLSEEACPGGVGWAPLYGWSYPEPCATVLDGALCPGYGAIGGFELLL